MNPELLRHPEPVQSLCPLLLEWPGDGAELAALLPDEIRVWLIKLDEKLAPGADEDALEPGPELSILSPDEQTRAARFLRARDRRRFARCRCALRQILGAQLNVPAGSVRLRSGGQGKPELDHETPPAEQPGRPHRLRFNVSHSGGVALVAVCNGREIGVDLEMIRPIGEADRIVASFFSPGELAAFTAIAAADKPQAFMRGWTRKEAILKGLGVGLAGLAARYETWFGTDELTAHFTPARPSAEVSGWQLWEAAPCAGHVAALAVSIAGNVGQTMTGEPDANVPAGDQRIVASAGIDAVD
jgi:4'-phosphopantetheinyl transferase